MRTRTILAASLLGVGLLILGCASIDPAQRYENHAYLKPIRANNHIFEFVARNAVDGEVLSYWEGAANSYPNTLTVDLEAELEIHAVRVRLNPRLIWQAREQMFAILVSSDGEAFTEAVPENAYRFDPEANENTVTIRLRSQARYVRLEFSANTEATGGQVAELEVYAK